MSFLQTNKKPITEYQLIREKAASQKRDVERALTRFIAKTGDTEKLFEDDPYAFPRKESERSFMFICFAEPQVFYTNNSRGKGIREANARTEGIICWKSRQLNCNRKRSHWIGELWLDSYWLNVKFLHCQWLEKTDKICMEIMLYFSSGEQWSYSHWLNANFLHFDISLKILNSCNKKSSRSVV